MLNKSIMYSALLSLLLYATAQSQESKQAISLDKNHKVAQLASHKTLSKINTLDTWVYSFSSL